MCCVCRYILYVASLRSVRVSAGNVSMEYVDELCYLDDMINTGGKTRVTSVAGGRSGFFLEICVLS